MPPALWWDGQGASPLMDPSDGETLGAAVLGQALGTWLVAPCWPCWKDLPPSSTFLSGASGLRCCSTTKMQMSQKVADTKCIIFFFLFKVIFESPSHSCLPKENFIHFPSNGNFFLIALHGKWGMRIALWIQIYAEKPPTQPVFFSLCTK